MGDSQHPAVYRLAVITCWLTILLLMAGALVTSNFAADSVPDWPLAYHRIIPPLIGGIRYEYAHRVLVPNGTLRPKSRTDLDGPLFC